ncbi:MAG: hypothetical protein NVSMB49_15470 [Ktedonobacteraceae bacterium]
MLSPDDTTQTKDAIGQVPRTFDRRSAFSERRQSILHQKQNEKETDSLAVVRPETAEHATPHAKVAWRQVIQLREENRRLRYELEEARSEMQRLLVDYTAVQTQYDGEVTAIHNGQLQELEHYQSHLQEAIHERNRLQEAYRQLERRYQELYSDFQASVQEEYEKKLSEATQTLLLSPDKATMVLPGAAMKTIELHVNQVKTKQLLEVQYLTSEVQRITAHLEQEQSQVEEERQRLLRMQQSAREQAELRRKNIQVQLRARWAVALAFVTTGTLVFLVVLQYLFLFFLHVHLSVAIAVSLIAPILLCVIAALVFSHPLSTIRHYYKSAPHKKKVQ